MKRSGRSNGTNTAPSKSFEIFVSPGFSGYELTAITRTLTVANSVLGAERFVWRYVSSIPGLVTGAEGTLVRAEPAIDNYGFSDVMIVVGGRRQANPDWMKRVRAMQRSGRGVVLLSDAATTFIIATKARSGKVTTHWRDAALVSEAGYHPEISTRLVEQSNGIVTAAGEGGTAEVIIGLISEGLAAPELAELGHRLILPKIRTGDADQPKAIASSASLFGARVADVVKLMEANLADPLSIPELSKAVGISPRQLERLFKASFSQTPARFYKRLRVKHARAMIEETLVAIVDVAVATGFGSVDTLAKAVKEEYGLTPAKMRARRGGDALISRRT